MEASMRHPTYTPLRLIQAVESVTKRTPIRKVEGLVLVVERMIRQRKLIPKSKRKAYATPWANVALEIGRAKWCRYAEAQETLSQLKELY